MPTAKKTPARKTASAPRAAANDAIKLLTSDHAEVKKLFKAYEKLVKEEASDTEKAEVATTICKMLTVHAQIEEEIFYPAAREVLEEQDLVDEADIEHASAKDLIAQIEASDPSDDHYDAKVKVLGEYIDHHVKEEETELFKEVKKAGLDTAQVGEELAARKEELMAEVGLEVPA
ncbi:hemerythrin domain-containing protein [Piscinibacter gummiphilus]|uniref:Hemerythrin n=1 Tax=Piscinibacter gummiphilus TaxID=946333 RepID=A0A1W6L2R9_9BURK|nr:hemerythrin domain-containing protein [Piscinibacter gummiphilus]ARN18595.1 hemerythrin [Piscinibacter gummiphilus]ATU63224.1 hemerythrin [Piscinibacter gummiphilus]GLS95555.1 hypothetical protein GCM10007918_28470 [Piscinibacter gummiphilus]